MHYQPGLRSFYKPCSKKFGYNIWVCIPSGIKINLGTTLVAPV